MRYFVYGFIGATVAVVLAIGTLSGLRVESKSPYVTVTYLVRVRDTGVFTDRIVVCDRVVSEAGWSGGWECWQRDKLVFSARQLSYTVEMLDPAGPKSEYIRVLDPTAVQGPK